MKAVLLDVYETLLTGRRVADPEFALRAVARSFGLTVGDNLIMSLGERIRDTHRRSPDPFPEIDIREIWADIFPDLTDPDGFAIAAENAVHPVTLMPGAIEALNQFHEAGLRLGIVSNAQAYTRHLLAMHLGDAYGYFDPELLVFSYQHRIAKPDRRLFQLALDRLQVAPSEVMMIGDSEPNDLAPARALGLRAHRFTHWSNPEFNLLD